MARKTRYRQYAEGLQRMSNKRQTQKEKATDKSLLKKLKELKGQEFRMTVAMENKKPFSIDQVAIRLVREPPLYSDFP